MGLWWHKGENKTVRRENKERYKKLISSKYVGATLLWHFTNPYQNLQLDASTCPKWSLQILPYKWLRLRQPRETCILSPRRPFSFPRHFLRFIAYAVPSEGLTPPRLGTTSSLYPNWHVMAIIALPLCKRTSSLSSLNSSFHFFFFLFQYYMRFITGG